MQDALLWFWSELWEYGVAFHFFLFFLQDLKEYGAISFVYLPMIYVGIV